MTSNAGSPLDTFPKLVRDNAERLPRHVAIREKDLGIWQSYTWSEYLEQARLIALGLAALGFARGDKTAIVGDNRPALYWAMLATQALGGVPVPLYQDSIEKEMEYIVDHAEARFAVVEDQEQVDKLLRVREQCPGLEYIVYDDARGLRALLGARPAEPGRAGGARAEVRARPRRATSTRGGAGRPRGHRGHLLHLRDDRQPKGAMLSYRNLIDDGAASRPRARGSARGDEVAGVPADGVGRRPHASPTPRRSSPASPSTARRARRRCSPTSRRSGRPTSSRPPRIWENILTRVMIRVEDAAWPKRRAGPLLPAPGAGRSSGSGSAGQPMPLRQRLLPRWAACWSTGRCGTTWACAASGSPTPRGRRIGPEIFVFFRALGDQRQAALRHDRGERVRLPSSRTATCGSTRWARRCPGSRSGSPSGRGAVPEPRRLPGLLQEPARPPGRPWRTAGSTPATPASSIKDGHLEDHRPRQGRGPAGRRHDVRAQVPREQAEVLALRRRRRCASAHGRPYVTALVNIDLAAVGNWAERRGIAYTSYTDLAPEARGLRADPRRRSCA